MIKKIQMAVILCLVPVLWLYGQAIFTRVTTGAIVEDDGVSVGCSWGDYNNDGFLDLFVANIDWIVLPTGARRAEGRENSLFRNNGDGSFASVNSGDIVNDDEMSNLGIWGDYNDDGWLDLFVLNGYVLAGFTQANSLPLLSSILRDLE